MDRREVEEKIQALARRRAETEEHLRQSEERLARLVEEQSELQGAVELRRRALADLEDVAGRLRDELRQAEVEEARAAVEGAVQARGAAAERAAQAVRDLRAAHERLEEARRAVTDAQAALSRVDPRATVRIDPEPSVFDDEWRRLAPLVEAELDTRLELELVAAAAASANPFDIEALPEHLRVLARARREELIRQRRSAS